MAGEGSFYMKKQKKNLILVVFIIISVLVIGEIIVTKQINLIPSNIREGRTWSSDINLSPSVSPDINIQNVSINFSNNKIITATVYAQTAYDALGKLANEKNLKVEIKQFKYGIMVTKIGETASSNQYYWSYKVNGKLGEVASDRFILKPGDKVEWEYVKITQ